VLPVALEVQTIPQSHQPEDRAKNFGLIGAAFGLGFILGPLMEENLRRAMLLSRGDATVFFDPVNRPISFSFLLAAIVLLVIIALPNIRRKREEVFVEEP